VRWPPPTSRRPAECGVATHCRYPLDRASQRGQNLVLKHRPEFSYSPASPAHKNTPEQEIYEMGIAVGMGVVPLLAFSCQRETTTTITTRDVW